MLEGTTVSEDFLATGLVNGASRCFTVSTVSIDGHESLWSDAWLDTPRYDSRFIFAYAHQADPSASGFRFFDVATQTIGLVTSGSRTDLDFRVDRHADGSLWLTPVRADVRIALYSEDPVIDLTSIDIAPLTGFAPGAIEAAQRLDALTVPVEVALLRRGGRVDLALAVGEVQVEPHRAACRLAHLGA